SAAGAAMVASLKASLFGVAGVGGAVWARKEPADQAARKIAPATHPENFRRCPGIGRELMPVLLLQSAFPNRNLSGQAVEMGPCRERHAQGGCRSAAPPPEFPHDPDLSSQSGSICLSTSGGRNLEFCSDFIESNGEEFGIPRLKRNRE